MRYKTVEVELDNGRVRPRGAETLPARTDALLIFEVAGQPAAPPAKSESLADRGAHLKGIGRGQYTDLSTNRRHMDDFGK